MNFKALIFALSCLGASTLYGMEEQIVEDIINTTDTTDTEDMPFKAALVANILAGDFALDEYETTIHEYIASHPHDVNLHVRMQPHLKIVAIRRQQNKICIMLGVALLAEYCFSALLDKLNIRL